MPVSATHLRFRMLANSELSHSHAVLLTILNAWFRVDAAPVISEMCG